MGRGGDENRGRGKRGEEVGTGEREYRKRGERNVELGWGKKEDKDLESERSERLRIEERIKGEKVK